MSLYIVDIHGELEGDYEIIRKYEEPTTNNDLGVDCISRADAIRVASGYCHPSNVANELAKLPSVTPQEPKTGHWIEQDGFDGDTYYDCSECGESFCLIDGTPTDNLYNYCPNCGAKMEVEDNG